MNVILGNSAAEGIGIGKAFVLPEEQERKILKTKISSQDADSEWQRFLDACSRVQSELSDSLKNENMTKAQHDVLETYM